MSASKERKVVLARRARPPTREAEPAVYQPRADYSALLLTLLKDACLHPIVCSNARRTDGNEAQILFGATCGKSRGRMRTTTRSCSCSRAGKKWALSTSRRQREGDGPRAIDSEKRSGLLRRIDVVDQLNRARRRTWSTSWLRSRVMTFFTTLVAVRNLLAVSGPAVCVYQAPAQRVSLVLSCPALSMCQRTNVLRRRTENSARRT